MLIPEYKNWSTHDDEMFATFFSQWSEGKNFEQIIEDLAYQMYQMHEVLEGILEDVDILNEH